MPPYSCWLPSFEVTQLSSAAFSDLQAATQRGEVWGVVPIPLQPAL